MSRTTDPVALNDWYVVTAIREIPPGGAEETRLLGQSIRILRDEDGAFQVETLPAPGERLRTQEKYGFLWVTFGTPAREIVDIPEFAEGGRRLFYRGRIGVDTSGQRVIENFIDLSHFSFVHTGTLGGYGNAEVPRYSVDFREDGAELWATECRFFQPKASAVASGAKEVLYNYRVPAPFIAILYKDSQVREGKQDAIGLFLQPLEETRCTVHSFALVYDDTNTDTHILHFYHQIFAQDRGVLIHQIPKRLPIMPRREIPTQSDAMSIAYRRWLDRQGLDFGIDRSAG